MTLKYEIIVHLDDSGDSITGSGFAGGFINGHMYIELRATDNTTGNIVQNVFAGKHRSDGQDAPLTLLEERNIDQAGDGYIADDRDRYNKTDINSPTYDPRINIYSHNTEISEFDFNNAIDRINYLKGYSESNFFDYTIAGGIGLSGNCVDFVQDIFSNAGLEGSVASLFSVSELMQSKFAGIYALIQEKYYVGGDNLLSAQEFLLELATLVKNTWNELISDISDSISQAYQDFLDAVARSLFVDPLVIDMAGDGLSLDSWQKSNALFDLDANGTKENTGWTKANDDDAFLVIDKNNNGNVDNIMEMFGNAAMAGFVDLKSYDSNGDNLINASDSQFNLMKLWNDKNANGVVDTGELTTLAANGITQISLNKYNDREMIEGNLQTAVSDVTFSNGTIRTIHELSFGFDGDTINSNPDLALGSSFKIKIETILLPYSRGYSGMYSWQAAMTLDSTLLAMAKDMAATQPKDFYLLNDKFQSFLFRWAGVENATAATVYGGANVSLDPRKMAFMEKITGLDFVNVTSASINLAAQAWDLFFNEFLTKFLVQGPLAAAFPNASYDFSTDTLNIGDTLDKVITNIEALASSMDLNSFTNYAYYAQSILQLNKSAFNDTNFDSKVNTMLAHVIGAVSVPGFAFDGRLNMGTGDADMLHGSTKNDMLHGLEGNDELYGYAGNDNDRIFFLKVS